MKNFYKIAGLACALILSAGFVACGGDSGTSAKDGESSSSVEESSSSQNQQSSSNENVDPEHIQGDAATSSSSAESSSSEARSSSVESSSSSVESSSSEVEQLIPYTTECPAGKACTYAPTTLLNPEITYGEFLDTRDYQVYKTVVIGDQTWMAQNLNYAYTGVKYEYESDDKTYTSDSTSWCYENEPDYCAKYGRLYTWAAAIDSVALANDGYTCGYKKECDRLKTATLAANPIQGVCPSGWHLPSDDEWGMLHTVVGSGDVGVVTALKSARGWYDDGKGTDSYGFAVLPAGLRDFRGDFSGTGYDAFFWSSTELDTDYAYERYFNYFNDYVGDYSSKYSGFSIRCIKD